MTNNKPVLQRAGIHLKEADGDAFKKSVEATRAVLDSIGTQSATAKTTAKVAGAYKSSSGRMY